MQSQSPATCTEPLEAHPSNESLKPAAAPPLATLLDDYCRWMQVRNYASGTLHNARLYLGRFVTWAAERGAACPEAVTRETVESYQIALFDYRKKDGQPLCVAGQHTRLGTLQGFFKWLCRKGHLPANPAAALELPKLEDRLPRHYLTAREAERILKQPNVHTVTGIRDRAMLEVLYSTGIRRKELAGLCLCDVDHDRSTAMIRSGKGRKDRLVPLGARAAQWLKLYLTDSRPWLASGTEATNLFLNTSARGLTKGVIGNLVRDYVRNSGVGKRGSCHLFRHTMATLMLENGADIRYVQQMLGHARLSTTEIYTHVAITRLAEVHSKCHPARLQKNDRKLKLPGQDASPVEGLPDWQI